MAQKLSKEKLDPVIRATPALRGKVKEARSRDSGNTTFHKEFLGGFLNILWANSSTTSRSTSAPRIVMDEVDEYDLDVGGQGDPIKLIENRAAGYARYKYFILSTPTDEDTSIITKQYDLGSQGRYYVPCPLCGHYQYLVWERLIYTFDGVKRPDDAAYQCESCLQLIDERHKTWMMDLSRAKWVHAHPERLEEVASYHINMLYQPAGWAYPWSRLAREYIEAYAKMKGGDAGDMKVFTNTKLAKAWKEKLDKVNQASLHQRREIYEAPVPRGVVVLIAAVDVQDNRLEAEVVGWGLGEESWRIEYRIFGGSPSLPSVWLELTDWLQDARHHADGVSMRVEAVGIDTGGHHTKEAYGFVEKYRGMAFALKGSSQDGAPSIPKRKPKKLRHRRLELYLLGTNALKDTLFARMKLTKPGPGFMHFPRRDGYDEDYFKGLASEVKKPRYKPRSAVQTGNYYDKIYTRNEPLDLSVYSLATLGLWMQENKTTLERLSADWSRIVERAKVQALPLPGMGQPQEEVSGVTTTPAPLPGVTLIPARPGRRVLSSGV
jgi:phage terminase large subunit GpA-like protein